MRKLVFALIPFLQYGCVTLPPSCEDTLASNQDSARIIVFRENRLAGALAAVQIGIDDCHVGKLGNANYLVQSVSPGTHEVGMINELKGSLWKPLTIAVEGGKDYYIGYLPSAQIHYGGVVTTQTSVEEIPKDQAIGMLSKLSQIPPR